MGSFYRFFLKKQNSNPVTAENLSPATGSIFTASVSHYAMTLKWTRFYLITVKPASVHIMTRPHVLHNPCQWLGRLYTVHASLSFLWLEWNVLPNVNECLRAFRALCSAAKCIACLCWSTMNWRKEQAFEEQKCWVLQSCYMIGRDS